ncbi:TPA: recombination protein NinB [Escherichia coli]|nr:recombination protein NinB [Escherichia coli]HBJ0360161.1 recombination protein NinB [Escherichia coli]HBJ0522478.1 recombination protein NinB [Escherichia coli]HBJ0877807.1 recombination protein NinB [Escherichia coli]
MTVSRCVGSPTTCRNSTTNIDGGVVMLGVRTSKMRKASMTELIEIMFWFGSERNVRWSDDSWREYEWSQRKGRAA